MGILFFLYCVLTFTPAYGAEDVMLMLNMNYSSAELKALRASAAKRGQQVIMVPPEEHIPQAEAFFKLRDDLEKDLISRNPDWEKSGRARQVIADYMRVGTASDLEPALNAAYGERIREIQRQAAALTALEEKLGPIETQLKAKAAELKRAGKNVDTMVVSSHSDGSNLSGETSLRLSSSAVSRLNQSNPELFQSPRHVLLLGCYNMTSMNRAHWRRLFANASLIGGFGVRAPSRKNPKSAQFINQTLDTATELDQQLVSGNAPLEPKLIDRAFRSLAAVSGTQSVLDYCLQLIESQPEKPMDCSEQWEAFMVRKEEIVAQYLNLDSPQSDPPHQDTDTDIRDFYTRSQLLCPAAEADSISAQDKPRAESLRVYVRESTIRLIYWWNVQKNFSTFYGKEVAEFRDATEYFGLPPMPPLNGETGRTEFIRRYREIEKGLASLRRELESNRVRAVARREAGSIAEANQKVRELREASALFRLFYPLYALQGEDTVGDGEQSGEQHTLDAGAIPFHWIEPAGVLQNHGERAGP